MLLHREGLPGLGNRWGADPRAHGGLTRAGGSRAPSPGQGHPAGWKASLSQGRPLPAGDVTQCPHASRITPAFPVKWSCHPGQRSCRDRVLVGPCLGCPSPRAAPAARPSGGAEPSSPWAACPGARSLLRVSLPLASEPAHLTRQVGPFLSLPGGCFETGAGSVHRQMSHLPAGLSGSSKSGGHSHLP